MAIFRGLLWKGLLGLAWVGFLSLSGSHASANVDQPHLNLARGEFAVARFSPDGLHLLTASRHIAQLWDVKTGREVRRFVGHLAPIRSIAFSPDGELVLTAVAGGGALEVLYLIVAARARKAGLTNLYLENVIRWRKSHRVPTQPDIMGTLSQLSDEPMLSELYAKCIREAGVTAPRFWGVKLTYYPVVDRYFIGILEFPTLGGVTIYTSGCVSEEKLFCIAWAVISNPENVRVNTTANGAVSLYKFEKQQYWRGRHWVSKNKTNGSWVANVMLR